MRNKLAPSLCLTLLLAALGGCVTQTSPSEAVTVGHVDLDRYMGRWYIIANIPYILEKDKVASYDTYRRNADGTLGNDFTFRKKVDGPEDTWHGTAKVINTTTNAEWSVRFVWPFTTTYRVVDLDPNYKWAAVATPGHKLVWVLARDRSLPDNVYQGILQQLSNQGFDTAKIVKIPQPAF